MTRRPHHEVHLEQDHKVIAIQYAITAIGMAWLPSHVVLMRLQLGSPFLLHHRPNNYYQFITMHGMIMVIYLLTALFSRGVWQLPHSADVRRADMVFPT